jgi:CDP-diacylglycerol---serine O-phosphatidyltransferase
MLNNNQQEREIKVTWRHVVPTCVTLGAMLAGFLSIIVIFESIRTTTPSLLRFSAQLIMLAMILDGIDGNIARFLKGTSKFGEELDTYVDLTAFGIAPALLIFAATLENREILWRLLLPSAVALSGVVRLARFKVKDPMRGQGGFAGLPITANAAWVALFVFISQTPIPGGAGVPDYFNLHQGWFATLFLVGIVGFIFLQVTNIRYPKPTKKWFLFLPCVALVALLWLLKARMAAWTAIVMIVLGLPYIFLGPLFVKKREKWKENKKAHALNSSGA